MTNVANTVGMNCQPFHMAGKHLEVAEGGRRHFVPIPPKVEGPLPGLLRGPGGRVTAVPARDWPGTTVGEHPASSGTPNLSNIIPKDARVSGVPCKGLQGRGIEPQQPLYSIRCFISLLLSITKETQKIFYLIWRGQYLAR